MRRILLLMLVACLALPMVAADEPAPEGEPGADSNEEASSSSGESSDETASEASANQERSCTTADINGPAPSRPIGYWVVLDPDGCYRRLIDRLLPAFVSSRLP